ncbi:MAG: site-specific DNA-methyltransferase [Trueperaceae bacterium]|nr:site-specific DNA-methyltransferase [Trueperaceae bacterium]
MARKRTAKSKDVASLTHEQATRTNIPSAEHQSVLSAEHARAIDVRYAREGAALEAEKERRNPDLDPQLVWRGKDRADWGDLVVAAPPLYIQEKVHPKTLIDDLRRRTRETEAAQDEQPALFADFNGFPEGADRTDFYQHEGRWQNRMILGDSLAVMASLAEREGLRGKVQCIYFDPPYGIKFNSNFQWSTTSRDVKDGNAAHITREPEQVKAFRDTWRDGIHSYLTYLRDRLTVARDLLTESGSIFVQIGDENVHRVRAVMDEVFGNGNVVADIVVEKTSGASMRYVDRVADYVLWYARDIEKVKYRHGLASKQLDQFIYEYKFVQDEAGHRSQDARVQDLKQSERVYAIKPLTSQTNASTTRYKFGFRGKEYASGVRQWATPVSGMERLVKANRVEIRASSIGFVRFFDDYSVVPISNIWTDTGTGSFTDPKVYVVQTGAKIVQRCILMATDPGDLVLDPTCGSGTTAYVAEQWGRRWITIDTSRVALALARARLMGARYPYYLLADSREGQAKEAEVSRTPAKTTPVGRDVRHGFVYERVPHITLKAIANNAEIDVIWEGFQARLEPLRARLNAALGKAWEEWAIPREAEASWPAAAKEAHAAWWAQRIARQREIDASIAAKADFEFLYDKPYDDKGIVRVAGPFTVESLSPHRMVGVDEQGERLDPADRVETDHDAFVTMVLENLEAAGVQQAAKGDRIEFTSLAPWPGTFLCAEGRYPEGGRERRAGIFVGPEFGTVTRPDLVDAAKEAGDAGFDVVIACGFNYDAHATEFAKLGAIPVLKARMNADLHMADDLKTTGKGNLFVVFGEPDIEVRPAADGQLEVEIKGVDVFDPSTGEVRADDVDGIALWMVDTAYDGESFFVRHAYFLGANDPYKALKTTLKAEIDEEAWDSLRSAVSRPFPKPTTGRIAVKAINHLGDEVMKVFRV